MRRKRFNRILFGDPAGSHESFLQPYFGKLPEINLFWKKLAGFHTRDLKDLSADLSESIRLEGVSDGHLITAFGLLKEVIRRQLNITPFDVQIVGGLALYNNKLIEMQTGEGKTLTALFPAYLNSLSKKGVHILTFNDYLAKRDANWMRPVYEFMGLSVGFVQEGMSKKEKKDAYNCDITYATGKEVGFDYLRSFIAYDENEIVLRPFHYAIIDEADAILIDEAKNPLVLAGDILKPVVDFNRISRLVASLQVHIHFDIDDYSRNIYLTEAGIDKIEQELNIRNLQAEEHLELHSSINLAIHARQLLKKDIDYVVRDGEIKLVDEFTGRIVDDRKWRNGLQTAVEAKERLEIKSEGTILNSITLQHFIQQYPKKAGMTATAQQASEEFRELYGLDILAIPPNRTNRRTDHPDEIFKTKEAKNKAILEDVKKISITGQPILIGTLTVKESEELAGFLKENDLKCQVLNAKNDELEAGIIANAGMPGTITISTNMAGRGTDILLGGKKGFERDKVVKAGGLYVIGTNRHESNRIDKQLKGRAGRQGDIGASRFFISLEDDIMVKYKLKESLPRRYRNLDEIQINKSNLVKKYINHIQRVIEGQAYDMRKTQVEYSGFIEKQRMIFQNERQRILFNKDDKVQLISGSADREGSLTSSDIVESKFREYSLFQYDRYWAFHLDYLQQIRDSIHLVRIGGQDPLKEFRKKADTSYKSLCSLVDKEIRQQAKRIANDPDISGSDLGINKPSSTWTYMINDNPFGNQLSILLLDSSKLGFQADPVGASLLFLYGVFERFKLAKNKSD